MIIRLRIILPFITTIVVASPTWLRIGYPHSPTGSFVRSSEITDDNPLEMGISWCHGAATSHHPFVDGFVPYKLTILGIPHLWKPLDVMRVFSDKAMKSKGIIQKCFLERMLRTSCTFAARRKWNFTSKHDMLLYTVHQVVDYWESWVYHFFGCASMLRMWWLMLLTAFLVGESFWKTPQFQIGFW